VSLESLFKVLIPILFAVTALPLLARFIVGNLVFFRVRKECLTPPETGSSGEKAAREAFLAFLKAKTHSPFPVRVAVRQDFDALVLLFQAAFAAERGPNARFSFSVSDLVKCSFLLMEELDSLLRKSGRFRRLAATRIATVRRINRVSETYNALYERLPFLKAMRAGRVTGKAVRLAFIPLLGLPSVAISLVASLVSLVLTEAPWRYYYAVILARVFRYGLMLYGDRRGQIRKGLERFSADRVKKDAASVEWILDPENARERSPRYERAFVLYQKALEDLGIGPEKDADFGGVVYRFNRKRSLLKRLLRLPLRAADGFNPFADPENRDAERLLGLVKAVASPYNDAERFYDDLRLIDLFDSLYMLSLMGYARILTGAFLLDNVSVDFLLAAKNLGDEWFGEILGKRLPLISRYWRSMRLYGKVRRLYRTVRVGNPVSLIWSLTGPIAAETAKTAVREYAFRRVGRMALYCYECNYLKKKRLF